MRRPTPYLLVALTVLGAALGIGPAPSATAVAKVSVCARSELSMVSDSFGWRGNFSASNVFREPITIVNNSSRTCLVEGWPIVQEVIAGSPTHTRDVLVRQNNPPAKPWKSVVLKPSRRAVFDVYGVDFDVVRQVSCPETNAYLVHLQHVSGRFNVAADEPACGAFGLYVAPIVSGSVDRMAYTTRVKSVDVPAGT